MSCVFPEMSSLPIRRDLLKDVVIKLALYLRMLEELGLFRPASRSKIMLPVLVATFSLCLTICWGGDPCPPGEVLKPCTCTHSNIRNGVPVLSTPHSIRLSREAITSSTRPSPESNTVIVASDNDAHAPDLFFDSEPESVPPRSVSTDEEPTNSSLYTVVECRISRSIIELEETLLLALHRKMVDKLIVSNVPPAQEETLARLPKGALRNTRIRQFEIRDSVLNGDFISFGNPFEGQTDTLVRFSANRCWLYGALTYEDAGTVNTKGLQLLPHIEDVDFSLNHLTFVKSTAFRYPPLNLSTIVLARNSLQSLEAGCFQYVPNLRIIDLSHNLLKAPLLRTIFAAPARFLETINLSWNFLTDLPLDFFVNMPALKVVNLSKNFLHSMPAKPWAAIWRQLAFVDVGGNVIDCDCHLLWLLPILSPEKVNVTTTPTPPPVPLSGQIVRGICHFNKMPDYYSTQHKLISLTRDKLMCR